MTRTILSLGLSGFLLAVLLGSCRSNEEAAEPDLSCISGQVVGPSCNGTLIQLPADVALGNTISYADTLRPHVIGTYSELPAGVGPGDKFTFSLRKPTKVEATLASALLSTQPSMCRRW
ncbi:hypothetical protein MUN84_14985 [Hymenobacter sp. 5516J-16]|uniref:hypothetical protein n=1 Tax=Hymenobacter sp. 5516J-16 TaxID=2932253 RepID=UPI001FD4F76B|nr:hypothetical protein [Hymenobacter sp. 5516J-16]UOQ75923.1 hypothetical protein MUN84_14985 [Hymenobacter sp. 5516J-16]